MAPGKHGYLQTSSCLLTYVTAMCSFGGVFHSPDLDPNPFAFLGMSFSEAHVHRRRLANNPVNRSCLRLRTAAHCPLRSLRSLLPSSLSRLSRRAGRTLDARCLSPGLQQYPLPVPLSDHPQDPGVPQRANSRLTGRGSHHSAHADPRLQRRSLGYSHGRSRVSLTPPLLRLGQSEQQARTGIGVGPHLRAPERLSLAGTTSGPG
jgi:hypothetical protein